MTPYHIKCKEIKADPLDPASLVEKGDDAITQKHQLYKLFIKITLQIWKNDECEAFLMPEKFLESHLPLVHT